MKKSLSSLSFQSMNRQALSALKGGGMSVSAAFCENKRCVPFQPNQCDVSTQFMCYCGSTTSPGVYACTKG